MSPRRRRSRSKALWPWLKIVFKWVGIPVLVFLFYVWVSLGELRFLMPEWANLTGFPFGERNYLVIVQDSEIPRPTGGAVMTYGILSFKNGIYSGFQEYSLDEFNANPGLPLPEALELLLQDREGHGFTFSYANFDPDFSEASEDLLSFFEREQPELHLEGVIAVDSVFWQEFSATYPEGVSLFYPWQVYKASQKLAAAFENKDIQVYFMDETLQGVFALKNWLGTLPNTEVSDILAVNLSQYGGGKISPYLLQDVTYELLLLDEVDSQGLPEIQATVTVQLTHLGVEGTTSGSSFLGYLQVLIPKDIEVSQQGEYRDPHENGVILGDLVSLNPGESATFTYSYQLPESVWYQEEYHLHVLKQAGVDNRFVRVIVQAPSGQTFESPDFVIHHELARFETHLKTDLTLSFSLISDEQAEVSIEEKPQDMVFLDRTPIDAP